LFPSGKKGFDHHTYQDQKQTGVKPAHNGFLRVLVSALPFDIHTNATDQANYGANSDNQVGDRLTWLFFLFFDAK